MSATDEIPHPRELMTIEEVDRTLDRVASTCAYSSSEIRNKMGHVCVDATAELVKIFRRLHSSEAKWMIRLLLKDLRLVEMPEAVTLLCFHFLLPDLLKYYGGKYRTITLFPILTFLGLCSLISIIFLL